MQDSFTKQQVLDAMYYNRLGVSKQSNKDEIKDGYFAKYKVSDSAERTLINKAKSCLMDDPSRAAYDNACTHFGIKDGEGGLAETIPEQQPASFSK